LETNVFGHLEKNEICIQIRSLFITVNLFSPFDNNEDIW